MATNHFELMNAASIESPALIQPPQPLRNLLQFPSETDEHRGPGGERRDGLGCAVALRLVLVIEVVVALSAYGVWRLLH
jgi:hypothetical protein